MEGVTVNDPDGAVLAENPPATEHEVAFDEDQSILAGSPLLIVHDPDVPLQVTVVVGVG